MNIYTYTYQGQLTDHIIGGIRKGGGVVVVSVSWLMYLQFHVPKACTCNTQQIDTDRKSCSAWTHTLHSESIDAGVVRRIIEIYNYIFIVHVSTCRIPKLHVHTCMCSIFFFIYYKSFKWHISPTGRMLNLYLILLNLILHLKMWTYIT